MKRIFLFFAIILCASSVFAQQSGYGGDGKAQSGAAVSSFIKLYETPPTAPTLAAGAGGTTTTGNHNVKITCYNGTGETSGGTASSTVDTATAQFSISAIPTCSVVATGRKVYMNTVAAPTSYYLVATIANNTGTTSTVTSNDATIAGGAAIPTANTMLDTRMTVGQSSVILPVTYKIYPSGSGGFAYLYSPDTATLTLFGYNGITLNTGGTNKAVTLTSDDGAGDLLKAYSTGRVSVGHSAGTTALFTASNSDTGGQYSDATPVAVFTTRRAGQTGDLTQWLSIYSGSVSARVTAAGWFQNTLGEGALTAAYTDTDATLGATNLSFTLVAGRAYRIKGLLQVSNTTAAEGVQFAFDGGAATATTFFVAATAISGTVVAGTTSATALATPLTFTTTTGTCYIAIDGYILANAGGTFILRAAEATTATGTVTIGVGSWLALSDTVLK